MVRYGGMGTGEKEALLATKVVPETVVGAILVWQGHGRGRLVVRR